MRMSRLGVGGSLLAAALVFCASAGADEVPAVDMADTVLLNGKFLRFDAAPAQALALRDGRITAIGTNAQIRKLVAPQSRVIDLAGRSVIPGLIDSHIHAIRAGLTYGTEVDWIGARSLPEALARLRDAARTRPKGTWLVVAGGWTEMQFAERRRPSQAEVAAAAPDHHVYIQRLYTAVLFSPGAFEALGVLRWPELASRLKIEADTAGQPTGWFSGDARTVSDLYDLLPQPDHAAQMAGTRAFFRQLNSMAVTGVIDPGGYNMPVSSYAALFDLWRRRGLTLRVAYSVCAPRRDTELEDLQTLTALLPMGAGDDWLRFNGIGENVVWEMYNNDAPSDAARARLARVLRWAAAQQLTATFHWNNNRSVDHLLRVIEEVNHERQAGTLAAPPAASPLRPLRWSIAHLNDASVESLRRMQALGLGWLVQNALYFRGEEFVQQHGNAAVREMPRIGEALRRGVPVGAGTDAHRVMSYNPFAALQWMLDGKTVAGASTRGPEALLTRTQALRLYTEGSAWFAHDEARRGALEPGRLADLAVLSGDYLDAPVAELGRLRSLLTMVGGRIVYASDEYAPLEERSGGGR